MCYIVLTPHCPLSSAVQGRGRRRDSLLLLRHHTSASVGLGAVVGAALLLFSQQHGLSCCHTVISVICVKDCGAKVQVPVYTEEEEVAAPQDRFLM